MWGAPPRAGPWDWQSHGLLFSVVILTKRMPLSIGPWSITMAIDAATNRSSLHDFRHAHLTLQ